jgi:hypothetical protein
MISKPYNFGLYTVMAVVFFISITSCSNSGLKENLLPTIFIRDRLERKNIKNIQFF